VRIRLDPFGWAVDPSAVTGVALNRIRELLRTRRGQPWGEY